MTNREKYKQAFSVLHTSVDFSLEGLDMKDRKKMRRRSVRRGRVLALCGATVLLVALLTAFGTKMAQDVGTIENGGIQIGKMVDGQEIIFGEPPETSEPDVSFYEGGDLRLGNDDILVFNTEDYRNGDNVELNFSVIPMEGRESGQAVAYGYYRDGELILADERAEKICDGSILSFTAKDEYDQIFIQSVDTDTIYIRDII